MLVALAAYVRLGAKHLGATSFYAWRIPLLWDCDTSVSAETSRRLRLDPNQQADAIVHLWSDEYICDWESTQVGAAKNIH